MMSGTRHLRIDWQAGALRRRAMALLVALLLPLLTPAAAAAAELYDRSELDRLFAELSIASDSTAAEEVVQRIWRVWLTPNDPDLLERMQVVTLMRVAGDFTGAMAVLDDILKDFPEFSEGWNQRAALNYMLGRNDASIADIDRVLALEPRHFGALAGRAMVHLRRGDRPAALRDIEQALKVHPFIPEREMFPELPAPAVRI